MESSIDREHLGRVGTDADGLRFVVVLNECVRVSLDGIVEIAVVGAWPERKRYKHQGYVNEPRAGDVCNPYLVTFPVIWEGQ